MGVNLNEVLKDHMEEQPYKITCGECGDQLDCDVDVDNDFDLIITVNQCKTCVDRAYDNGYQDAEENGI